MNEQEYYAWATSLLRAFGQEYDVHVWLVVHPTKVRMDSDGRYPVIEPYDMSGTANFANKPDFILSLWRDLDDADSATIVYVKKLRFDDLGKRTAHPFKFQPASRRFEDIQPAPRRNV
jgi:twinkle protein